METTVKATTEISVTPWHAEGYHIYDAEGSHVGFAEPTRIEAPTNATLMAAAPIMFDELEQLTAAFAVIARHTEGTAIKDFALENFRRGRAAIAKARGQQS